MVSTLHSKVQRNATQRNATQRNIPEGYEEHNNLDPIDPGAWNKRIHRAEIHLGEYYDE